MAVCVTCDNMARLTMAATHSKLTYTNRAILELDWSISVMEGDAAATWTRMAS